MLVLDKYIFKKSKAVDLKTCDHIISVFEKSNPKLDELHDYYLVLGRLDTIKFNYLLPILMKSLREYCSKHPFLGARQEKFALESEFNIQKYLPGTCYQQRIDNKKYDGHMEHGKNEWDCRRILGWMVYLNDIKKYGGTYWPQQRFTTKPRAGDLYIWPAGWTHSHMGIVAPNEIKYILTGWCSLNP